MTTAATGTSRPGLTVGPTSEFSLFFRVMPGHGGRPAGGAERPAGHPGYRPGDYGMAIATIHEARFVLFDDDTRLAFVTSFDGPWDAYMEDFFTSGPTLALFDVIFRHTEGYGGLPDVRGAEGLRPRRAADRRRLRAELRRHGQGDPQGAARQRGVPAGAGRPATPPRRCSTRRCGRCWTRPPTSRRGRATGRGRRCRTTSPGRGPWPSRSRTSPTSTPSPARSGRGIWCSS